MKISKDAMKLLLEINNAIYDDIKLEFLYHSNKYLSHNHTMTVHKNSRNMKMLRCLDL